MWIFLFIFTFLLQKSRRCSVKKCFLKNVANFTGKYLCWSLFLIKLQVFKNTYFEEHLWTTACKNINICLLFKVLFLCRIKILNSNGNKKKKHVRKCDVNLMGTRIVGDRRLFYHIRYADLINHTLLIFPKHFSYILQNYMWNIYDVWNKVSYIVKILTFHIIMTRIFTMS